MAALEPGSVDHRYLQQIYERHEYKTWSRYATNLFVRTKMRAQAGGYLPKLRYLLYEDLVDKADAYQFAGFEGVLLQGKPGVNGRSTNPHIAELQVARNHQSRSFPAGIET